MLRLPGQSRRNGLAHGRSALEVFGEPHGRLARATLRDVEAAGEVHQT
ncbi:hypothetical protein M2222_005261 [Bradyrhizobium elkanii]|nr:hypothetical protein [Bradyrhizobium elkanii]MCS3562939.1 hypothetical protein [Bradyrhizobium elkanii]MCW2147225.1 hypothetical protein [Bradyrhizobium elkanii]MCW2353697.1 hypothetical protein [Bradyrhizobium elkanii]MCW2380056.1 hypothetical protein [Bradyrhizobium elkanii]